MKGFIIKSAGLLIFSMSMALAGMSQPVALKKAVKVQHGMTKSVDAKDFFDPKSPTCGLQEAVDRLKPDGGTLYLSPGVYKIRKSIVLSSGISIIGTGETSIIERADSCLEKYLTASGKEGDTELQVGNTEGFIKGGEVVVFSSVNAGFNCTSANVTDVKGNSITLDRPLRKIYATEKRAMVANYFPVFTLTKGENIRIENLVIDGKMKPGLNLHGDFVYSAIHLVHVANIGIDKVIIKRFPGDGFSIQGGSNASVTNCLAEYLLGNGFHPGTTLRGSTWTQNTSRYNGGDGLYFCFNVRYATVADNHFYNNKENGIGDLGKGGVEGDQMNVVSGNFCYNNGKSGIQCTPGGNNIVINNICENNSRSETGKYPAISLKDTHSTILKGNRCSDSSSSECAIQLSGKCENNVITDNILTGYAKGISGENMELNTVERNLSLK